MKDHEIKSLQICHESFYQKEEAKISNINLEDQKFDEN